MHAPKNSNVFQIFKSPSKAGVYELVLKTLTLGYFTGVFSPKNIPGVRCCGFLETTSLTRSSTGESEAIERQATLRKLNEVLSLRAECLIYDGGVAW